MALLVEVGKFTSPVSTTGNQAVSLSSFAGATPKAVIVWTGQQTANGISADLLFAMGAATSTSARASIAANHENGNTFGSADPYHDDQAIITSLDKDGALVEAGDLASFTADTFTVNWSTSSAAATVYHFIALGGDEIQANVIQLISPATGGAPAVGTTVNYAHGLSVAPTALLAFSSHGIEGTNDPRDLPGFGQSNVSIAASDITTDALGSSFQLYGSGNLHFLNAKFLGHAAAATAEIASVSAVDATNITINWEMQHQAEYYYILAMSGVTAEVGTYTSPASASTRTVSTGITPLAFITWGVMDVASAFSEDNALFSFGASDGTSFGCAGGLVENSDNSDSFSDDGAVLQVYDHSQLLQEAATATISGADVSVVFSAAVAAANVFNYLALGTGEAAEVPEDPPPTWRDSQPTAFNSLLWGYS